MTDNNPKPGPEVSRRGLLKGAAIAGVSAVLPVENVSATVETSNESDLGRFIMQERLSEVPA